MAREIARLDRLIEASPGPDFSEVAALASALPATQFPALGDEGVCRRIAHDESLQRTVQSVVATRRKQALRNSGEVLDNMRLSYAVDRQSTAEDAAE